MPAKILDADWITGSRYFVNESGCWIWRGSVCSDGYGKCGRRAGQTLAHRAFYAIIVGKIPENLELDHLCKNRLCVNPDHLEPVTHVENVSRGDYYTNHRNRTKTYCIRGHELASGNLLLEANGARKCRTCRNANKRRRWHEKKGLG